MNKKILRIAFVSMITLFVGYTAYNSQKGSDNLSLLMLDNVEALANEASFIECYYWGCQYDFRYNCSAYGYMGIYMGTCYGRRG